MDISTTDIALLPAMVSELLSRIAELEAQNRALREENVELRRQLGLTSTNSHRPPSSDGYKKKAVLTQAEKPADRKVGGQKGHQGHTLPFAPAELVNDVVEHKPTQCSCGAALQQSEYTLHSRRQVFDLPKPRLYVTEHRLYRAQCSCGQVCTGHYPADVLAPTQYGNGVKAFATLLNVDMKLPFGKVSQLFQDMYNSPLSEQSVITANESCYKRLEQTQEVIGKSLIEATVKHADETGIRVAGKLLWLHTICNETFTYLYASTYRGMASVEDGKGLMLKLKGWLIHDCWGAYFKFEHLLHGICGAHLLRELEGLKGTTSEIWALAMQELLFKAYKLVQQGQAEQARALLSAQYDAICRQGYDTEPKPDESTRGRPKQTKGRNLLNRLTKHRVAVQAFAYTDGIPFTNNTAERALRPVKTKLKVSGCFRTLHGADVYARIHGFCDTVRKHKKSVFQELCNTFAGENFIAPTIILT